MDYLVRKDQNLFDIATQNFGQLDNIVQISNDNAIIITDPLDADQILVIDNVNKGAKDIKKEINEKELTFNNKYEA